jgi:sugar phosphate isomerase/epimerase
MMKMGFSTLACPSWSLPQILRAAAEYGYDGVELRSVCNELDLWKLPDFQPRALGRTRKRIEDHAISISCVDTSACFHSPEAAERKRNFDLALRMAEIATGLGAPSIRVFGDRIQPGRSREETIKWIVDSLIELAERLKFQKVEVWLETHGDFATSADVGSILDKTAQGSIGMIWDPANAFAQIGEAPLLDAQAAGRIRHVHLKDLRRNAQCTSDYVLVGHGEFPFETMFESLVQISYEGFVSFEWEKHWHPELASPEVALPSFIEWWKRREAS